MHSKPPGYFLNDLTGTSVLNEASTAAANQAFKSGAARRPEL
jgi:hypothetical protein